MPLPAVYTESSLLAYMETELGETGETLGLLERDGLAEAVNEVIGLLGHALAEETTTAGLMKVRAAARWQAWRAALNVAAGRHDLRAGSADLKQSQLFSHMQTRLSQAEADYASAVAAERAASGTTASHFVTVCGRRGR